MFWLTKARMIFFMVFGTAFFIRGLLCSNPQDVGISMALCLACFAHFEAAYLRGLIEEGEEE